MGSILSRRIAGVEDIDIQANSAYRYPPKSGERSAPGAYGKARAGTLARRARGRGLGPGRPARRPLGRSYPEPLRGPAAPTPRRGWGPRRNLPEPYPALPLPGLGDLGAVALPRAPQLRPRNTGEFLGESPRAGRGAERGSRRIAPA